MVSDLWEKEIIPSENSETAAEEHALLNKAIHFAVDHHAGAVRKGSGLPYILHPLETMQILNSMKADIPLLIAGVLHDTVEDTDATIEEITSLFGSDIGTLVNSHTEDKSLSWKERKQHAIDSLAEADFRLKMLVLADKVSNLRSIVSDYKVLGDKLWESFSAPFEKQIWYYTSVQNALHDLEGAPQAKTVYKEMTDLNKTIFKING